MNLRPLKHAKEELSRYSQDLERQVRNRTREINSILKYTPAVVYIKDKEGRYILVNSRFEELFDVAMALSLQPVPKQGTEIDPVSVMAVLKQINSELTSFKGIGRIKIWRPEGLQSTRIVWAGDETQKMRIEILGIGGRPFSSVVYDGSRLSVSLHSEGRFYQKQTRQADLSRLISLPLTVRDAHTILAGRVPLLEDATLTMEKEPSGNQHILVLSKGWFRKKTGKRRRENGNGKPGIKVMRLESIVKSCEK